MILRLVVMLCLAISAAGQVAGRVTEVTGNVFLLRAGSPGKQSPVLPVRKGTTVRWNDHVKTAEAGAVTIQLKSGAVLNLGPDTSLRILQHDERSQQTLMELIKGHLHANIPARTRPGSKFEIRTNVALCAAMPGGDFTLDESKDGTELTVESGSMFFRTSNPGHLIVKSGQKARATGRGPAVLIPAAPKE